MTTHLLPDNYAGMVGGPCFLDEDGCDGRGCPCSCHRPDTITMYCRVREENSLCGEELWAGSCHRHGQVEPR